MRGSDLGRYTLDTSKSAASLLKCVTLKDKVSHIVCVRVVLITLSASPRGLTRVINSLRLSSSSRRSASANLGDVNEYEIASLRPSDARISLTLSTNKIFSLFPPLVNLECAKSVGLTCEYPYTLINSSAISLTPTMSSLSSLTCAVNDFTLSSQVMPNLSRIAMRVFLGTLQPTIFSICLVVKVMSRVVA